MESNKVTEIDKQTHAHYCAFCASQGKEVLWAHGNENAGNLKEHRCPVCGHVEWVKVVIPNGKLPQPAQRPEFSLNVVSVQDATIYALMACILMLCTMYFTNWIIKTFVKKES